LNMVNVEHLDEMAQKIAARHACDVVQVTYRREQPGWVLRVLIEKRGSDPRIGSGVDHALCSKVSRDLGDAIDVEDAIIDAFTLEVSSPGIERPLTRLADFDRFKGREARVETSAPIGGSKRHRGKILGARGEDVELTKDDGGVAAIPFQKIAKAHLVFEMDEMISRAGEK
jgi:ribosome maturation factor RimP